MKIISWNVAGYRAVLNKGFNDFMDRYKPDILCLQEPNFLLNSWNGVIKTTASFSIPLRELGILVLLSQQERCLRI